MNTLELFVKVMLSDDTGQVVDPIWFKALEQGYTPTKIAHHLADNMEGDEPLNNKEKAIQSLLRKRAADKYIASMLGLM